MININAQVASLSVTTSSASVALPTTSPSDCIVIDNSETGATECYVKTGSSTVTADTTAAHIAAGEKAAYRFDPDHTHIAAITASGSTTLRVQRGDDYAS